MNNLTKDLLLSGQIHKKVRKYITQELLGEEYKEIKLYDLATNIENKIKELTKFDCNNPLNGGVAFPTGLNINHCAAHWTPNPKDKHQILGCNDLIKIDYGVHVNGMITDGAFSFSFSHKYDNLIKASQEATRTGISLTGPDAYLGDIGKSIQEIIESYEVTIDDTIYPLKSIGDLSGHQISKYKIHAGKPVPNILFPMMMNNDKFRMREGEVYAIETFPTTGSGSVKEDDDPTQCSHYMANYNSPAKYNTHIVGRSDYTKSIHREFNTLAFCKRWIKEKNLLQTKKFRKAVKRGIFVGHPPMYSESNSFVAQTEHTIYISPKGAIELN